MKSYVFSDIFFGIINQPLQLLDGLLKITKENENGLSWSDVIHLLLVGIRVIYLLYLNYYIFLRVNSLRVISSSLNVSFFLRLFLNP